VPTPVFVLGKHRSGTTWLANLLCRHPEIAGIQHERHRGIHESAFFSSIHGRYGDLQNKSSFIELVEVIAASDYFRLAGADRKRLHSLWPTSYEGLFRSVMDAYAARQAASYWVEKTPPHTLRAEQLAQWYPDALFIGVVRDPEEVVASTIARSEHRSPAGLADRLRREVEIVRTAFSRSLYNRIVASLATRSEKVLIVDYRDLLSDLPSELRRICGFLGIPYHEDLNVSSFPPNTSFTDGGPRSRVLSAPEARLVRFATWIFDGMPLAIARWLAIRRVRSGRGALPPWFFAMLPVDLGDAESSGGDDAEGPTPRAARSGS
jgi:hypothetical protein